MMHHLRSLASRVALSVLAVSLLLPAITYGQSDGETAEPTPDNSAQVQEAWDLGLERDFVPPDLGQSRLEVFVPATGHSIRGYMLDYWRANGSASVYGNPVSEVFVAENQLYSQAFERGVFQFSPYWMWSNDPAVRLMPVGRDIVRDERLGTRSDGRRTGATRDTASWSPGNESQSRANDVSAENGRYSESTGFSISGNFADWYDRHEGQFYLGEPISEPMQRRGARVQYYENGILQDTSGAIQVAPMVREQPDRWGVDTTPVAQGSRPTYEESLFYTLPNPYGVDVLRLTGQRHIVVNIYEQTMYVYQGDTLVLQSLVSTGLDPNFTEVGDFRVRIRKPSQTMDGFTNSSGEVIDEDQQDGSSEEWEVEDVPDILYFNTEAEALHGAYWHNNFGNPMSHGCVNQPLDIAAWVYQFSPLGTRVTVIGPVHEKPDSTSGN